MEHNDPSRSLAQDIRALESETFEISDYSDDSETVLAGSTSTSCSSTTSTTSGTTSTTSCTA